MKLLTTLFLATGFGFSGYSGPYSPYTPIDGNGLQERPPYDTGPVVDRHTGLPIEVIDDNDDNNPVKEPEKNIPKGSKREVHSIDINKEIIFYDDYLMKSELYKHSNEPFNGDVNDKIDAYFNASKPITIKLSDKQKEALANPDFYNTKISIGLKGIINTPAFSGKMEGIADFNRDFRNTSSNGTYIFNGTNQRTKNTKFYTKFVNKNIEYKTDGVYITFTPYITMNLQDYYDYWNADAISENSGQWQFSVDKISVNYEEDVFDLNSFAEKNINFYFDPNVVSNYVDKKQIKTYLENNLMLLYPELPHDYFNIDLIVSSFNPEAVNPNLDFCKYTLNLFGKESYKSVGNLKLNLTYTRQINLSKYKSDDEISKNDLDVILNKYHLKDSDVDILWNKDFLRLQGKNEYVIGYIDFKLKIDEQEHDDKTPETPSKDGKEEQINNPEEVNKDNNATDINDDSNSQNNNQVNKDSSNEVTTPKEELENINKKVEHKLNYLWFIAIPLGLIIILFIGWLIRKVIKKKS